MSGSGWCTAWVLTRRECVRFGRQRARVLAAVGTPLLLWLLLTSGLAQVLDDAALGGQGYGGFLLPGAMTLAATFAAVFSCISLIEDRQAGWLQAVLVAPTPRWSIALGRIAGGSVLAWAQGAVLLVLAPMVEVRLTPGAVAAALAALALTAVAMTSLGVAFAWRSASAASFHAVMNLVFVPMWLLSGAFFPVGTASTWIGAVALVNPLSWCTMAIRAPLADGPEALPMLGAAVFALAMGLIATLIIARPERSGPTRIRA